MCVHTFFEIGLYVSVLLNANVTMVKPHTKMSRLVVFFFNG